MPVESGVGFIWGQQLKLPSVVHRDLETLRLYNQLVKMPPHGLTRKITEFDIRNDGGWTKNLEAIMKSVEMTNHWESCSVVSIETA